MKEGDKVIVVMDWDRTDTNKEGTIEKWRAERGECRVDSDWFYTAYVFPLSAREDIHRVQVERARLKLALDDSMKLVYELANKQSRGEYK